MSVRREVVSLSQLLRRNESSSSRRGAGHAPSLPLQTSTRRTETPLSATHRDSGGRQTSSALFTERPTSSRYQPQSFTQRVRDASRVLTSQSDVGASSQTSTGFPALSPEVYEAESEQLSAMTSMSQSSFSLTQSQNLLASSQDDQLQRLQQWQAQQAPLPAPPSPTRCDDSHKLQGLERKLTQVVVEQTREQKHQQRELMDRFASPINKSVEAINAKLTTSSEDQRQQSTAIGGLAQGISSVAATVTDLKQQSIGNKAACEETRKTVTNEAAAVKAALTELQARVGTVEDNVKSFSETVSRVLEGDESKHEALLSAVAASSCNCPKAAAPAEEYLDIDRASRKRERSPRRCRVFERNAASFPSVGGSPPCIRTRSSSRYEVDARHWRVQDDYTANRGGLYIALQRIEALRAKRRSYQLDF